MRSGSGAWRSNGHAGAAAILFANPILRDPSQSLQRHCREAAIDSAQARAITCGDFLELVLVALGRRPGIFTPTCLYTRPSRIAETRLPAGSFAHRRDHRGRAARIIYRCRYDRGGRDSGGGPPVISRLLVVFHRGAGSNAGVQDTRSQGVEATHRAQSRAAAWIRCVVDARGLRIRRSLQRGHDPR